MAFGVPFAVRMLGLYEFSFAFTSDCDLTLLIMMLCWAVMKVPVELVPWNDLCALNAVISCCCDVDDWWMLA